MSVLPKNEEQVCNAVAHFLEARSGDPVVELARPDQEHEPVGNQPEAVERVWECGGVRLAVEHTRIESFPGQTADSVMLDSFMKPVVENLRGSLPSPGHYLVEIQVGALKGLRPSELVTVRQAVEAWVRDVAPTLTIESDDSDGRHTIAATPPGVPFSVALYRWSGLDGAVIPARLVPNDIEEQRAQRVQEALSAKCPKLASARGDGRSILVLESDDFQLANRGLIGQALVKALENSAVPVPDDVYLVETEWEPWTLWVLKEDDRSYRTVADAGPHQISETWRLTPPRGLD